MCDIADTPITMAKAANPTIDRRIAMLPPRPLVLQDYSSTPVLVLTPERWSAMMATDMPRIEPRIEYGDRELNTNGDLANRVAVVTGSARNIGRAIALALARAGAAVVVNTLQSAQAAEDTAADIRAAGGRAIVKLADIKDPQGARALVAAAVEAFGALDILVNNAAVRHETDLATMSYEDWRAITSVILDGAFLMTQAAMPHLVKSGQGSVINIGGMTAHVGAPRRVPLITAKIG